MEPLGQTDKQVRRKINPTHYLGDGLYADFDGNGIMLWTEREHGKHYVYLEPSVLEAFEQWVAKIRERNS